MIDQVKILNIEILSDNFKNEKTKNDFAKFVDSFKLLIEANFDKI